MAEAGNRMNKCRGQRPAFVEVTSGGRENGHITILQCQPAIIARKKKIGKAGRK